MHVGHHSGRTPLCVREIPSYKGMYFPPTRAVKKNANGSNNGGGQLARFTRGHGEGQWAGDHWQINSMGNGRNTRPRRCHRDHGCTLHLEDPSDPETGLLIYFKRDPHSAHPWQAILRPDLVSCRDEENTGAIIDSVVDGKSVTQFYGHVRTIPQCGQLPTRLLGDVFSAAINPHSRLCGTGNGRQLNWHAG